MTLPHNQANRDEFFDEAAQAGLSMENILTPTVIVKEPSGNAYGLVGGDALDHFKTLEEEIKAQSS